MSELKPCPKCGSRNVYVDCMVYFAQGYERYYASCYDCGLSLGIVPEKNGTWNAYYRSEEDCVVDWNIRADEDDRERVLFCKNCRSVFDINDGSMLIANNICPVCGKVGLRIVETGEEDA